MAKLLLQRSSDAAVGVHLDSNTIALTARGDGVSLLSAASMGKVGTLALGSAGGDFGCAAVVCQGASTISAVLAEPGSQQHVLVTCPLNSTRPKTLAEVSPRVPLPSGSTPHALHVLSSPASTSGQQPSECVALVLQQGTVAWTLPSAQSTSLSTLPAPSAQAGLKLRGSAASQATLALLLQGNPGTAARLQLYTWRDGCLTPSHALSVDCPSSSAIAQQLCLASTYAAVTWSNRTLTLIPLGFGTTAASPDPTPMQRTVEVRLADITGATSASLAGAPAQAAAGGSRRKRGAGAGAEATAGAGAGTDALPASTAMVGTFDDTQLIVAWLVHTNQAAGAQPPSTPGVHYALVDAQFGCVVSSGHVALEASLLPSPGAPCTLTTSAAAAPGLAVVQAGRSVLGFRVQAPRASLLSLVGKVSLTAAAAAAPGAAKGGKQGFTPGCVWTLEVEKLATREGGEASSSGAGVEQGPVLRPTPAAVARGDTEDALQLLSQLEAAAAAAAKAEGPGSGGGGGGGVSEQEGKLLDKALAWLLASRQPPQQRGQAPAPAPPPRLLALLSQRLAAAGRWDGLLQLLAGVGVQGLQGCSAILPAAAAAHQYRLVAPLCCKLDDVQPSDMLSTLSTLLAATSGATQAPRREYYLHLRQHAETAIAHAEAQLPRCQRSQERRDVLIFAQCAAALLDGFSYREVLLHPLLAVPMDGPGLQSCLAKLSNSQVDALLAFLSKWMDKYTKTLGEGAAQVPLPQELLFPTFSQVLEWLRLTLDAHTARLLMSRTSVPAVPALARCLEQHLHGAQQLLPLLGTVEHIEQRAPLPAAHVAAATQYTVELLDLRIKT